MFADDTKLYRTVSTAEDGEKLQSDLNRLAAWSNTWLLKFNEEKCVVLKFRDCIKFSYSLNGFDLEQVDSQRDLGIIMNSKLSPVDHIKLIVNKATQRLHMIRRCFSRLSKEKLSTLYTSIVRPILEYGSVTWNPWLKQDINALESVQKKCQNMCLELLELNL